MPVSSVNRSNALRLSFVLVLVMGLSMAFVVAGRPFLSEKYSYDEQKIAALARQEPGIPTDRSFQIVADTYRLLGLADQPTLAGMIGFLLFSGLLFGALRGNLATSMTPLKVGLLAAVTFLGAVYLGHYAKEVFILGICAVVLVRIRSRWWDVVVLGTMVFCAMYFRTYWFIVAAFYLAFRILLKKLSPINALLGGALVGLAALSLVFSVGLGLDLDHYRLRVNDSRVDGADAQTAIHPLVSFGGVLGGYVNALAVLISFVIPIPLVLKAQVFYLMIVAFCLALWIFVFKSLLITWRVTGGPPEYLHRMTSLLFAFTVVQSIFEPDYGSYIRHLSPMLPLMLGIVMLQKDNVNLEQKRMT